MDFILTLAHIFVDEIAGGRSTVRVFILILLLIIFGIIFFISNKKKNKEQSRFKSYRGVMFCSILVLFLIGIGTQILLFNKSGIEQTDFAVFFNHREITSSTITHTHVLKSVAYKIAGTLGVSYEENIDIGAGIAPFIPDTVAYVSCIILLLIFTLQLYSAYRLFPVNDSRKYKIIWAIVFTLTQFVIIKAIIDGGIFSEKIIVWIFVEFLVLFQVNKLSKIYYSFLASIVITLAISGIFVLLSAIPAWQFEKRLFIECGVNIILMILMVYLSQKRIKRIDVLLGIFGIICMLPSILSGFSILTYRDIKIASNDNAIIGTYLSEPSYKEILSVGNLKYQIINSTTTIGGISDSLRILDNFEPVSLPWKTCLPSGINSISFLINSRQVPRLTSTSTNYFSFSIKKDTGGNNFYKGNLTVSTCIPRPLNLLNELGLSFGLEQWYIWNIRESDPIFNSKKFE